MNSMNSGHPQSVGDVRASELDNALGGLDSAGGALHCSIDSLEERLGALLAPRNVGDKSACADMPPHPPCAPLVAKLKNQTVFIGSASDRITSLLSRLCC